MKKLLLFFSFWLTFFFLISCVKPGLEIHSKIIPPELPTSFFAPLDATNAKLILIGGFEKEKFNFSDFYRKNGFVHSDLSPVVLGVATNSQRLFAGQFFSDPKNKSDVLIFSYSDPMLSSSFFTDSGAVLFGAKFSIKFEQVEALKTRISVRSVNPLLSNGEVFNWHVMGYIPDSISVNAIPLDEYRLLVYVAYFLNITLPTNSDACSYCGYAPT